METKTVTVNVAIQMDVDANKPMLSEVQGVLELMNTIVGMSVLESQPQIFVGEVTHSVIFETNRDEDTSMMDWQNNITKIKKIIEKQGSFNITEVDNFDSAPVIYSKGEIQECADAFNKDGVDTTTYVNNIDTDHDFHQYEDLTIDQLNEVLNVCELWDVQCDKTMERCQD